MNLAHNVLEVNATRSRTPSSNADLAMRSAILARSRVEQNELCIGDWCFYWKLAATKLDPFRWRGPCLVVVIERQRERDNIIYWVVHGSSLVRCTRNQLRQESVPERFERQSQPAQLEQLRQRLMNRLLKPSNQSVVLFVLWTSP